MAAGRRPSRRDGTFVGRDRELADLIASLDEATAGSGRVAVISGPPGIGKTRLAEELSAAARRSSIPVAWGRGRTGAGGPEVWPWAQVVAGIRRAGPRVGAVAGKLAGLDALARHDVVAEAIETACARRPLLIVLDDLDDGPALALVDLLAPAIADLPVLLVAIHRDGVRWSPPRPAVHVALRGLDQGAVAAMAANVVGEPAPEQVLERVVAASGGNPLFLSELLTAGETTVTAPVAAAVGAELELLSSPARAAVEVAAVIGREPTLELLGVVVAGEPVDVLLTEARALRIVVTGDAGRLRFRDGLTRDAIEAGIEPVRRAELHGRIARALRDTSPTGVAPPVEQLAHHVLAAAHAGDDLDDAIQLGRTAVASYAARSAWRDAAHLIDEMLALLPSADRRRIDLLLRLGDVERSDGLPARARAAAAEAGDLARRHDDPSAVAAAALGFAGPWTEAAVSEPDVIAVLERALTGLAGSDPMRPRLLGRLAQEVVYAPDRRGEAEPMSREALELAAGLDDTAARLWALQARHAVLAGPAGLGERLRLATALVSEAEKAGHEELVLQGLFWRFADHLERGDLAAVEADLAAHDRLARHTRQPLHASRVLLRRGMLAQLEGRFADAERLCADALAAGQRAGNPTTELLCAAQMWTVRYQQGRVGEIEGSVASALAAADSFPIVRCGLALFHTMTGRADLGEAELARHVASGLAELPDDGYRLMCLTTLAEVSVLTEDGDGAAILYDALVPFADHVVVAGRAAAACWGPVARPLGMLAAVRGDRDVARAHLEAAVEQCLALRAWPWLERTHQALDRLKADGDRGAPRGRPGASGMRAMLRRDGAEWEVTWQGTSCRIKHKRGLLYLAHLLTRPGVDVHVSTLVAAADGSQPPVLEGDAGPAIDRRAAAAYRSRLRELRDELERAEKAGARTEVERLQVEEEWISGELSASLGIGGRLRPGSSTSERARKAVTNAVKRAVEDIAAQHAALGVHLGSALRTGTTCSYRPLPPAPEWQVSPT